ncbi:hypothetical protein QYF61_003833 [Mycteria americana]|uniref:Uncharacterized protein n=1 Tax=Mycteria americana TaxID=33587 RepID=A0AAN7N8A7_MYCAM|nr:hypothetical protein QYF61_003833 [Mycteria americana]
MDKDKVVGQLNALVNLIAVQILDTLSSLIKLQQFQQSTIRVKKTGKNYRKFIPGVGGKIDPGDGSGLSDLYDPVAASLKKAAAAYGGVCAHATEFKQGPLVTAVPSVYSVSGNFTRLPQLLEYDGQWPRNFICQFPRDLRMHLIRSHGLGYLRGFLPGYSTKQMPEEVKACSPDVQGSELAVRPPRCPKDLVLHHFMVTAAKAALELHIPHRRLLVGENKVQHSTSPCWLLSPWEKEVIISAFEEPPGLLMACCVVPPRDIGVVEVPHEEEGLMVEVGRDLLSIPSGLEKQGYLEWVAQDYVQTHRMIWVAKDLKDHLVPTPCHGQGQLPLDQVAQSPMQPGLEHFQGWGIHNFSGQSVPVPHHPLILKCTLSQVKAITPCPVATCPCKKSLSSFLVGPLQVLEGCYKVSPEPFLLQAEQPQLSQAVFIGEVLQPSDHLCGPPLDLLRQVHVRLLLGAPELNAVLQGGSRKEQSRVEGQNHLP